MPENKEELHPKVMATIHLVASATKCQYILRDKKEQVGRKLFLESTNQIKKILDSAKNMSWIELERGFRDVSALKKIL